MTVQFCSQARLLTLLQPYLIDREIDCENSYSVLHYTSEALFQKHMDCVQISHFYKHMSWKKNYKIFLSNFKMLINEYENGLYSLRQNNSIWTQKHRYKPERKQSIPLMLEAETKGSWRNWAGQYPLSVSSFSHLIIFLCPHCLLRCPVKKMSVLWFTIPNNWSPPASPFMCLCWIPACLTHSTFSEGVQHYKSQLETDGEHKAR